MSSGARFAGYTMVGLLGSGAWVGCIWQSTPGLPRGVALKILAAALHHPLIVEAHDRGQYQRRLRALLARAHGDETGYRDYRDRYRAMATELGLEGHLKWAEATP